MWWPSMTTVHTMSRLKGWHYDKNTSDFVVTLVPLYQDICDESCQVCVTHPCHLVLRLCCVAQILSSPGYHSVRERDFWNQTFVRHCKLVLLGYFIIPKRLDEWNPGCFNSFCCFTASIISHFSFLGYPWPFLVQWTSSSILSTARHASSELQVVSLSANFVLAL